MGWAGKKSDAEAKAKALNEAMTNLDDSEGEDETKTAESCARTFYNF